MHVTVADLKPEIGDSVTFSCDYEPLSTHSSGAPNIRWTRRPQGSVRDLPLRGDAKFVLSAHNTRLTVNNVVSSDAGSYTCTVRYPIGSGFSTGHLVINGPPSAVSDRA